MDMVKITSRILKKLYRPPADSRKGNNGRLLIIAGSPKYHGAAVLCASMAAKICDLVYLHTTRANFDLIKKTRARLAEFIYISERDLKSTLAEVDAVLIGPGLEPNARSRRLVNGMLKQYPDKKMVIDAGALRVVDLKLLNKNCVLTPHLGEFKAVFFCPLLTKEGIKGWLIRISRKYPAVIVLKGPLDYVCQRGRCLINQTGNAGLTKGGTGDVLAGLTAALLTKNEPITAAAAGVYLNGLAGDALRKKYGLYYSASELINENRKVLFANQ